MMRLAGCTIGLLAAVACARNPAPVPPSPPQTLQAAQVSALVVGELVLSIRQIERTAYRGTLIPQATHERAQDAILLALRGASAYERSVTAWTALATPTMPEDVRRARDALLGVLAQIDALLPQYPEIRTATTAARAALGVRP